MELPENVEFHPRAFGELESAFDWYERINPKLAERFRDEIRAAAVKIVEAPQRWPEYSRRTQYVQLRRFPYLVVYEADESAVHVVAIAHAKRRPHYWRKRLKLPKR